MMHECGARRPTAMQCTVLVCQQSVCHDGDHIAQTDAGTLASWADGGRVRFWPKPAQRRIADARPVRDNPLTDAAVIAVTGRRGVQQPTLNAPSAEAADEPQELPSGTEAASQNALRPRLNARQSAILVALLAGRGAQSTAEALGVTEGTVRTYIRSIRVKFGVTSDRAMLAAARELGYEPA